VTLQSAAPIYGSKLTTVVMTGMGRDGALGAAAVRAAGGRVIAQDKETSVVYGMPKAVVEMGLADEVLPLGRIAAKLARLR
jgi:two-component system chemotaxis response regulator CheB